MRTFDHGYRNHTMKMANRKPARKPKPVKLEGPWQPANCFECGHPFGDDWKSDYSLSSEKIFQCRCGVWSWPPIPDPE